MSKHTITRVINFPFPIRQIGEDKVVIELEQSQELDDMISKSLDNICKVANLETESARGEIYEALTDSITKAQVFQHTKITWPKDGEEQKGSY